MLNTKGIKTEGGSSIPKTLQPGNHTVTIYKVSVEEFKFKPGGLHVLLHVVGPDLEDGFEGFWVDKNDESLGRFKGQVGRVKASEWAFADGTTKSGIVVHRDNEILRFLKTLCVELGVPNWVEEQDAKYPTIEAIVEAFDNAKLFANKELNVCIGGKEYLNKEGYTNYDMFFPKPSKQGVPFEAVGKKISKVLTFNESEHVRKKAVEEVKSFGSDSNEGSGPIVNSDFKL